MRLSSLVPQAGTPRGCRHSRRRSVSKRVIIRLSTLAVVLGHFPTTGVLRCTGIIPEKDLKSMCDAVNKYNDSKNEVRL